MAKTAHDLDKAGAADTGKNLISIDPQVNWRRFPTVVLPRSAYQPAYVPVITYTGGVVNEGANAGNGGETGTYNSTYSSRGQGWMTQAEKATLLGTTMAVDVTKSYGTNARGSIGPRDPYPTA